jgi:RimJ/RimL family protein N-acetyltransferase
MLRKEFWGQGLASEFLNAWLQAWRGLPRSERESRVAKEMVNSEGLAQEHLIAITEEANSGSQKVLLKAGFERFREFNEEDVSQPNGIIKLIAFRYFPSREGI